ncbi:MAG TPA: 50S ribosomal protein L21 [Actinomycetota bacterium]|nr:50S ribosomal protein L21 [Actinomycetota bacterium]
MYALIRAGGKQHKVAEGDVIDIERVKDSSDGVEFVPLLVVDDGGNTISDRSELARAVVKASVVGESKGPKVEVFKYRNKTGYRRSAGHRQRYTTIRIESISLPGRDAPGGGNEEGGDGS